MTTHRVAKYSLLVFIHREAFIDEFRQFLSDVIIHMIVVIPWLLRGIQVEAGTQPEIICPSESSGTFSPRGLVSGATSINPSSEAMRCAPAF